MIKMKSRKGGLAVKIDLEKAYDRVDWGFLQQVLVKMAYELGVVDNEQGDFFAAFLAMEW